MLFKAGLLGRVRRAAHAMILCSGLSALFPFSATAASSLTLVWNPSSGTNIAGYKIYYGVASRTYTNMINVGNLTNATIANLISGATYFFAATAYDSSALESDYSTEAVFTNVTATPPTIVLSSPPSGASYAAPATINLAATVTANGHAITKVQFYNGATLLAEDPSAPYSFAWTSVGAGNYSLTAQAVYDSGITVASTPAANVLVAAARPVDTAPAISAIPDQTMTTNSTQRLIRFTISDAGTGAANLTFYASSTNPALLPTENIVFAGSDTNRTITLTPRSGQTGEVDITITVSDGSATTNANFHLSITEQIAWTLWWESTGGDLAAWSMSGTNLVSGGYLEPRQVGPVWRIGATGDFNGDGQTDLLWQCADGSLASWFMNGTNQVGGTYLTPAAVDPSWKIVGTGNFNGDGKTDILWQNTGGYLGVWYMDGTSSTGGGYLNPSWVDPSWKIVGTGDFDGDGKTDILWQNTGGSLAVWFMNGINQVGGAYLTPAAVDPSWKIVGTGDFDGDGKTDILWQNTGGYLAVWYMDGIRCAGGGYLNPAWIDPSWKIVGPK